MPAEILALAWGAVLLLVHIFAAAQLRTRQYGLAWNAGPRDTPMPPLDVHAGRLARAQANFLETFPLAIVALLGVVLAGRTGASTALGGWIWLAARAAYLPLYWFGVPVLRSLAFLGSLIGIGMALWPLLTP